MVGCLGGPGRSVSKWMIDCEARHFVFLGRSGLDKAAARNLVENLEASGVSCAVVHGDVHETADVQAMILRAEHSISGVVQATMGLYVCFPEYLYPCVGPREITTGVLLTGGKTGQWYTGMDPKV